MTGEPKIAEIPFIIDETMAPDQFRIGYLPKYEALTRPGGAVFDMTQQHRQESGDILVRVTFAPDFVALRRLT